MQRAIYKEGAESERLKLEIQSVQSNPSRYRNKSMRSISSLSASPTDLLALQEMRAKRQVALARVSMLQQERSRQLKSLEQLKETLKNLRVDNHTRGILKFESAKSLSQQLLIFVCFSLFLSKALHLKEKHFHLQMDKDRLAELVKSLASTEEQDTRLKHQLVARRRQLFLELVEIFPIVQVGYALMMQVTIALLNPITLLIIRLSPVYIRLMTLFYRILTLLLDVTTFSLAWLLVT
jgi:hypothetical protein